MCSKELLLQSTARVCQSPIYCTNDWNHLPPLIIGVNVPNCPLCEDLVFIHSYEKSKNKWCQFLEHDGVGWTVTFKHLCIYKWGKIKISYIWHKAKKKLSQFPRACLQNCPRLVLQNSRKLFFPKILNIY